MTAAISDAPRLVADDGSGPRDELLGASEAVYESADAHYRLGNGVPRIFVRSQFAVSDLVPVGAVSFDDSAECVRVTCCRFHRQTKICVHDV